jgi:hypothetical protein
MKFDQVVEFSEADQFEVEIQIIDGQEAEPDEEFYIELYEIDTKERLAGLDTKTTVTIIDDDRPAVLCFKNKGMIQHLASDTHTRIPVQRLYSSEEKVTCQYKTFAINRENKDKKNYNEAVPGVDYEETEGTIVFEPGHHV